MSNRVDKLVAKAKRQIESCGWTTKETLGSNANEIHLELTRNGKRKGWGLFDRTYCWTEAYETITDKCWVSLLCR